MSKRNRVTGENVERVAEAVLREVTRLLDKRAIQGNIHVEVNYKDYCYVAVSLQEIKNRED